MSTALHRHDDYQRFLYEAEEAIARLGGMEVGMADRVAGRPGCCHDRCGPLSVLPVEAFAIIQGCAPDVMRAAHRGGCGRCAFLRDGDACAIGAVRPFICRARGVPLLRLDEDGQWRVDPQGGEGGGLRIDVWNARLFRINAAFCGEHGIPARRIPFADLMSAIGLFGDYRAFTGLARPQGLAFSAAASR